MTATLITTDEVFEGERTAEFRRSARQRDMLKTLNRLFDELSPARMKEDILDNTKSHSKACSVSRVVRD